MAMKAADREMIYSLRWWCGIGPSYKPFCPRCANPRREYYQPDGIVRCLNCGWSPLSQEETLERFETWRENARSPRIECVRIPGTGCLAFKEWTGLMWTTWTVVEDPHYIPGSITARVVDRRPEPPVEIGE